jgi:predicted transcriptional regulator
MKELTKAEEELMQVLWDLSKGFVKDIIARLPEPQPKYTTVSTIIRILEEKGFVGHNAYGNSHEYYPLISKEAYSEHATKSVMQKYFGGSLKRLVSFFVDKNDVSDKELEELKKIIEKNKEL